MTEKNLGKVLLEARKKKGYSRRELSEKTHISEMSIRRYESGEREPPYVALVRLQKVLDLHLVNDLDHAPYSFPELLAQIDRLNDEYANNREDDYMDTLYMLSLWDKLNDNGKELVTEYIKVVQKIPGCAKEGDS